MKEIKLFTGIDGPVTNINLFDSLKLIGADDADVLYIHTALNFGTPNRDLTKKELLTEILDVIKKLNVATLIFPTYTFSFCNGESFNVQESRTSMGLLNEFARKQKDAIRSYDPLMSNVLIGEHKEFVTEVGNKSTGDNSTFDLLHRTKLNVKFLFLGPSIGDCYTYMHFIEERVNTPYRYKRNFTGKITDKNQTEEGSFELFVRYANVLPGTGADIYENILLERREAKRVKFGNGMITVTDEKTSYNTYIELITNYPNFFLKEPFDGSITDKSFRVQKMVAL